MGKNLIIDTLNFYKIEVEKLGYNVLGVYLKGSQNYNLQDEDSDIDVHVICAPTIEDIRLGFNTKKIEFEQGQVVINSIYDFTKIAYKGNPAWIEMIHTDYFIGLDLKSILGDLKINTSALYGMMLEKKKSLTKEYPSKVDIIKKFGYDPKQYHHIVRLDDLLTKLIEKRNVRCISYKGDERTFMLDIKRNMHPMGLEYVMNWCERIVSDARDVVNKCKFIQQDIEYSKIDDIVLENLTRGKINTLNEKIENSTPEILKQ